MPTLQITTEPPRCVYALSADDSAPKGIHIEMRQSIFESVGAEEIILALITLSATIPINILSNWLTNKLINEKPQKIKINDHEVSLKETEIRRVITEEIKKQTPGKSNQ